MLSVFAAVRVTHLRGRESISGLVRQSQQAGCPAADATPPGLSAPPDEPRDTNHFKIEKAVHLQQGKG